MHWNHRIIRKVDPSSSELYFEIHEVQYNDDGGVEAWAESAVSPFGESKEELESEVRLFHKAFEKPILECKTVERKEVLVEIDPS
jgi:hypothetical protein